MEEANEIKKKSKRESEMRMRVKEHMRTRRLEEIVKEMEGVVWSPCSGVESVEMGGEETLGSC